MTHLKDALDRQNSQPERRRNASALRSWAATEAGLESLEHLRDAEPANLGEGIAKAILKAHRPDSSKETDQ